MGRIIYIDPTRISSDKAPKTLSKSPGPPSASFWTPIDIDLAPASEAWARSRSMRLGVSSAETSDTPVT